ncbi:MAG: hypothetical protein FWE69_04825 [Clostridiales bacterium]|nr:hypothetical protein [Clostridiales bacterium]
MKHSARLALIILVMVLVAAAALVWLAVGLGVGFAGCFGRAGNEIPSLVVATPTASADASPRPAATPAPTPDPTPTSDMPTASPPQPQTDEDFLALYIQGMSTEEKLGQLVMFGFQGTDEVSEAFAGVMRDWKVGNVILYGYNIVRTDKDGGFARCAALNSSVQKASRSEIPLLISLDAEGGKVVRFRWPKWPSSAATLGKRNNPDEARALFSRIGTGLLDVGINVNLAPCLDVARVPEETFLTTRIISANANVAANIGTACIEGMQAVGCVSIAKHFPGHGATTEDSHERTPVVSKTLERLTDYDLIPFAAAVETGVDGILVAHISYPKIDPKDIASMSDVIIGELLRQQMGFDGIVMSDDFRMTGLTSRYTVEKAAVRFILAGGDLILCGPRHELQRRIMTALTEAAADGTLSPERIDESVTRILRAKMKYLDFNPRNI